MKLTLYMPYYDYNDGAFDVGDGYYSEGEYADAVSDEFNKSKDAVYESMVKYKDGTSRLLTGAFDSQTYKFGFQERPNEDKVAYCKCGASMYNGDGAEEDVDGLISHFVAQDSFVEMVEFCDDTDDEFVSEVSMWVKEHNDINRYAEQKGYEWAFANEPERSINVHFVNKAGEDIYAILDKCKIMDIADNNCMIIFISKLRLIDKFM